METLKVFQQAIDTENSVLLMLITKLKTNQLIAMTR